ncbi:TetR/AcrR family transcriptional regulator [Nocardia sp. CA2R105]|uniref:TetR/AcrR family transcriptional regulator n=1 Tax=Nocardia coffeae TaxID=2873381 RepID=UPI001CA74BEA|nr:TetR/AcrR family transcriptional regulator [Nocardia coffeae]MBY8856330.1 TetR/AcrR family transcriptional regulator [Nocardia coffeae]
MAERQIPDDLARLWRLPLGTRLGRPAELDVDTVVRTAIDLADRTGLSGATLPKIAAALGVTPMSLYRHIGSKDELIALMSDAAFGPTPEPGPDDEPWRSALSRWARDQFAVFERHPWLVQIPISGPPRGPHAVGWMDAGLRALRATDADWGTKIGVITVLSGYVRQGFLMANQLDTARRAADLDESRALRIYSRELTQLVDPDRFPDVAELLAAGLFESVPPPDTADEDFTFGLELILDGVAGVLEGSETYKG